MELERIGTIYHQARRKAELPFQGKYNPHGLAVIQVEKPYQSHNYLAEIEQFQHLWLIFGFHLNSKTSHKARLPARNSFHPGVFASRSPYRPNQLGLSCVELQKREGSKLYVRSFDLLDQTPIYDIKPYVPSYDALSQSRVPQALTSVEERKIIFLAAFEEKNSWLIENCELDLKYLCHSQLAIGPLGKDRKRIQWTSESQGLLAFRTWRIMFEITKREMQVLDIHSGYSQDELKLAKIDPYQDKKQHLNFCQVFR